MSAVSGKKRKSLSSPPSQASISKFFKSCTRSPKKVPALKADDGVITINDEKEEKAGKIDVHVEEKPSKVSSDVLSKLETFKSPGKSVGDKREIPIVNKPNGKAEKHDAMDTSSCKYFSSSSTAKSGDKIHKAKDNSSKTSSENTSGKKSEKSKSDTSKSDASKSEKTKSDKAKSDKLKSDKSKHFSSNKSDQSKDTSFSNSDEIKPSTKVEEVVDRGILFSEIKNLKKKVSFTALEQQVITIKVKHLDVLLFVECGYRYRFFGEDAEIAAKELDITAHLDHNFMTGSIPVHRLTVHVSRLVEKGYKVGLVSQTETAALKAAGDNKNAPFTRKLSKVYTKATFVDREESEESSSDISSGRYVISICEIKTGTEQPYIGMYCVNPTSGDIACVNIEVDENILSKIETIFCALKPSEVLLPKQVSNKKMDEYIKQHCKADEARVERLQPSEDISITEEQLKKKLGADFKCNGILKCINLMATYLKEFEMQNLVQSLRNYRPYSVERNCMHLDGATIKNLELLENTCNRTIKGSLLWIVDHTDTVFGKRLLKRWVIQPLINIKQINKRLDAVGELVDHVDSTAIQEIKKHFQGCLDIEKNLTGIFYRKITPDKFIKTMEALAKLNSLLIKHADELNQNFTSPLLQSIFSRIPKLLGTDIDDILGTLDKEQAVKGNKEKLFRNLKDYPHIGKATGKIKDLEEKLQEHKNGDVRKILGGPVEYKSVSGSEYLIEVKNKDLGKVPKDWVKVNSTKQCARFRPLYVEEHFKKLCQTREKLKIAADAAWERFLNDFSDMYDFCRKAVLKFAELDCLLSLATVAKQSDHCRPEFDNDCNTIEIINGRHPVLSALLPENEQYVGNDINLSGDLKSMIVSGPNMGGKSSYIRQVAVNCILAQIGSYIPASSARLCALDGIYTRMGSSDDIARGKSTFMVELEQASMIIREATSKSLVILDELGRGTSTYDGMAIAFATLKFFIENTKSFTLFVTHYPMLSEFERLYPKNISNHHMAFMSASDEGEDNKENVNDSNQNGVQTDTQDELKVTSVKPVVPAVEAIIFLYKLIKGAAKKSYGLNVARLAGIPDTILTKASFKSFQMENEVQQRMDNIETLKSLFCSENSIATLKELVGNG